MTHLGPFTRPPVHATAGMTGRIEKMAIYRVRLMLEQMYTTKSGEIMPHTERTLDSLDVLWCETRVEAGTVFDRVAKLLETH